MADIFDKVASEPKKKQDIFDTVEIKSDIFDEVGQKSQRGRLAELGAAHARGWLGMSEKYVGAAAKFAPILTSLSSSGAANFPAALANYSAVQQGIDPLTPIREKMKSAQAKFPKTREGLGGWAINVLGEGAPILMTSIASGGTIGPAGAFMNMFIQAGEGAYAEAKAAGASEAVALRDYALSGLVEGALEMWGVSRHLKFKAAGKASLKSLVKNVKKRLFKDAGKDLTNIGFMQLKSAFVEGAEEWTQAVGSQVVKALPGGADLPRKTDGDVDWEAMAKEREESFAGGALLGSVVPQGMNIPAGIKTMADPSAQLIEQTAKDIRSGKLGEYEKARRILELRELLPEDYEGGVEEKLDIPPGSNVYRGKESKEVYVELPGQKEQITELQDTEEGGTRLVHKETGEELVQAEDLMPSGQADQVTKPTSPFHISEQAQRVIDVVDKFEKDLVEVESQRKELEAGITKERGKRFKIFDKIRKKQNVDPDAAMADAKMALAGRLKEIFPDFAETFPAADVKALRRAILESTLTATQVLKINEVLESLEKGDAPTQSSLRQFDEFFGTNILKVGANKSATWKQKLWKAIRIPGQTYKAIRASIDHSAMLIQGFTFALTHPIEWAKVFVPSHRTMVSEDYLRLREIQRKSNPHYQRTQAATNGRYFTEAGTSKTEEEFVNNYAHKIPIIGKWIKASERAHVEGLNGMREIVFKFMDEWGDDSSFDKDQQACQHISNLTGRFIGDSKKWFEKHMDVWSTGFWTPRMIAANFHVLFDWVTKPEIRKMAAYDLVKGTTLLAALTALISMIPGVDVEDDPRSSNIGKGKIGNRTFTLWGRYGQYIRVVAQLATETAKSPTTGDLYHRERVDTITKFLRGKMNPVFSPGVDIITGKTYAGDPMQYDEEFLTKYIAENISPLFIKDVVDSIRFQGLDKPGMILAGTGFYGIDATTFETDASQSAYNLKNDYAHQYYGEDWDELGPAAQGIIRARQPMIRQYEEDSRREINNVEYRGKRDQFELDTGAKVVRNLPRDLRKMYEDSGAKVIPLAQGVGYSGSWWKMNFSRYKKFQKKAGQEMEKALRDLKTIPSWNQLDSRIQRELIEDSTKAAIKYARQKMMSDINFVDLEQERLPTND